MICVVMLDTLLPATLQEELSKEEVKVALLSALLLPLRALQSQGKKGKTMPAVPLVVGDSMKWTKKYATIVQDIHTQAPELLKVSQTLQVCIGRQHATAMPSFATVHAVHAVQHGRYLLIVL